MNNLQQMLQETPFVSYSYSYPHKSAYRPFEPPIPLKKIWQNENQDALFLYVHLPFCEYRCGFCNLFTLSNPQGDIATRYLDQLHHQAQQTHRNLSHARYAQLAIGGGTPTYLECHELEQLFSILRNELNCSPKHIPTGIEVSPATISHDKLNLLKEQGVDRISIGIQSFFEHEALSIGRPQKRAEISTALNLIREIEFPTLNIDLIYGAEEQTVNSWIGSIRQAIEYDPEELYLYPLYVRPLTGLGRKPKSWDDHRVNLYRAGREYLLEQGYEQTSLRMFQQKSKVQFSEVQYHCQTDGMIGLGCGARSYSTTHHYSNEFAVGRSGVAAILENYLKKEPESFNFAEYGFQLNQDEQQRRFIILSLLQTEGLSRSLYFDKFGKDVLADYSEIGQLIESELAVHNTTHIKLTEFGLERSDMIGPWLYSASVKERMESFECL